MPDTKQLGPRILIIGCPGGGKTTLALRLAEMLDLPVVHLDSVFWKPHWTQPSNEEFLEKVEELIEQPRWIIEGHYGRTLPWRLQACSSVIVMHIPTWLCLYRVVRRAVTNLGKTRPDLADDCPEHIDWAFFWYVAWTFPRRSVRHMYAALQAFAEDKPVVVLRTPRQLRRWLSD
ncbi:MAG: AAA family ATPase [Armatimonadota bacterium]